MEYNSAVVGRFAVEFDVALYNLFSNEETDKIFSSFSLLFILHRGRNSRYFFHYYIQ